MFSARSIPGPTRRLVTSGHSPAVTQDAISAVRRGRGTCGADQMRRADRVDLEPVCSRQAMFLTTQRPLITGRAELVQPDLPLHSRPALSPPTTTPPPMTSPGTPGSPPDRTLATEHDPLSPTLTHQQRDHSVTPLARGRGQRPHGCGNRGAGGQPPQTSLPCPVVQVTPPGDRGRRMGFPSGARSS